MTEGFSIRNLGPLDEDRNVQRWRIEWYAMYEPQCRREDCPDAARGPHAHLLVKEPATGVEGAEPSLGGPSGEPA